ncbi:hypothetical protein D3C83_17330 [compost metagenome]
MLIRASNGPMFAFSRRTTAPSRRMLLTWTRAGFSELSDLLHAGILSNAFWLSTRSSTSMLSMILMVRSSENRSGVTVTLPTLTSPLLPTTTPFTFRCGTGKAAARRL